MRRTPSSNSQGLNYHVDIVMCIDATGSMGSILSDVKANALSYYPQFVDAMELEKKKVGQLRIKVIAFRDYGCDSEPMKESKFFVLPDEQAAFDAFVDGIEAIGGGDDAENALEAMALAMKSDWTRDGNVRRHVIMMYTDAPALKLGERAGSAGYPADMPKDLAELQELWEGQYMEKRAKRILIWAPDAEPWSVIAGWNQALLCPSEAGCGCDDTDTQMGIQLLVKSI